MSWKSLKSEKSSRLKPGPATCVGPTAQGSQAGQRNASRGDRSGIGRLAEPPNTQGWVNAAGFPKKLNFRSSRCAVRCSGSAPEPGSHCNPFLQPCPNGQRNSNRLAALERGTPVDAPASGQRVRNPPALDMKRLPLPKGSS